MNNGLADCFDTRSGCAACAGGKCTALTGWLISGVKKSECVFYKTREQKRIDDAATILRLTKIGEIDLLEIYEEGKNERLK